MTVTSTPTSSAWPLPPSPEEQLRGLFRVVVENAHPRTYLHGCLPSPSAGKTIVVGFGKAAASMAAALESSWKGPLEGIVVVPRGHREDTRSIVVLEASHPVPDKASVDAALRISSALEQASVNDLVMVLVSGGGSSVLCLPVVGVTLDEKVAVYQGLLRSGASIQEMNCVRKHLSRVKGGRLAAMASQARMEALVVSDVPGDDLSVIASGPTLVDESTLAEARAVLRRYRVSAPASVIRALEQPENETIKSGDLRLSNAHTRLIFRPDDAFCSARRLSERLGYRVIDLGSNLSGDAKLLGEEHARIAMEISASGIPSCIVSGGETTVQVASGNGEGGRNTHYLLSLAIALRGHPEIYALAADTDGIDGNSRSAGAYIGPDFVQQLMRLNLDPHEHLDRCDSHTLFSKLGALIVTGPTKVNVNDFRAILVNPASR